MGVRNAIPISLTRNNARLSSLCCQVETEHNHYQYGVRAFMIININSDSIRKIEK